MRFWIHRQVVPTRNPRVSMAYVFFHVRLKCSWKLNWYLVPVQKITHTPTISKVIFNVFIYILWYIMYILYIYLQNIYESLGVAILSHDLLFCSPSPLELPTRQWDAGPVLMSRFTSKGSFSNRVVTFKGCFTPLPQAVSLGDLPSLKLTNRTWKWMVAIRSFPFGPGLFSGANC